MADSIVCHILLLFVDIFSFNIYVILEHYNVISCFRANKSYLIYHRTVVLFRLMLWFVFNLNFYVGEYMNITESYLVAGYVANVTISSMVFVYCMIMYPTMVAVYVGAL